MNTQEEEQALIKRAKLEPEAFGELYERYVERIYNYIYFRIGNVHDAEDLTGKVFLRRWKPLAITMIWGCPFRLGFTALPITKWPIITVTARVSGKSPLMT